ncbi:hypothetical protein M0804_015637 [Polistes exclamans]|nr:hypothetical protein M0804_015637 [Polistes exclamans]
METCLEYDVVGLIFQYLNGLDLYNASKVCRSWFEIAQYILKGRKPTCISRKYDGRNLHSWNTVKNDIIDSCKVKPSIHMLLIASPYSQLQLEEQLKLYKGCICEYLPLNCYSISIQKYIFESNENTVTSMFFPEVPKIKISTITLNWHLMDKGIYCEELKCLIDEPRNADKLKNIFDSILNNDWSTESCLIIFYDCIKITIIHYLMQILNDWFPRKKVTIWGGLAYSLSVCNFVQTSRICQSLVDCTCILMTGTDMQSWTVVLKFRNDAKSLEEFKNIVQLKKHSVGFMASSYSNYYDEDEKTFKTYFPNIPLFTIYDSEPLTGEYFSDICPLKKQLSLSETNETTFMILTYN